VSIVPMENMRVELRSRPGRGLKYTKKGIVQ
jgi:hypothetical protein